MGSTVLIPGLKVKVDGVSESIDAQHLFERKRFT